jgi:hypothetical protein
MVRKVKVQKVIPQEIKTVEPVMNIDVIETDSMYKYHDSFRKLRNERLNDLHGYSDD